MSNSNIFSEKFKQQPCVICMQNHSPLTLCKHEILVQIIDQYKHSVNSLAKANREAVSIAKDFQNLLRDLEPFTSALKGQADMLSDVIEHALDFEHFTSEGSTENWARETLNDYRKFIGPKPELKAAPDASTRD